MSRKGSKTSSLSEGGEDDSSIDLSQYEIKFNSREILTYKGSWDKGNGQNLKQRIVPNFVWLGRACAAPYCNGCLRGLKRSPEIIKTNKKGVPIPIGYCSLKCVQGFARHNMDEATACLKKEEEREAKKAIDRELLAVSFLPADKRVDHVTAGELHTVFATHAGHVFTFGDGGYGKLGHGDTNSYFVPKQIVSLHGVFAKKVSAGPRHTLMATKAGEAFSWGSGKNGRLGHGNEENQLAPVKLAAFEGRAVVSLSAGEVHSIFAMRHGVATCGGGLHGCLGSQSYHLKQARMNDSVLLSLLGLGKPRRKKQTKVVGTEQEANSVTGEGKETAENIVDWHNGDVWWPTALPELAHVTVLQVAAGFGHNVARTNLDHVWTWGQVRSSK